MKRVTVSMVALWVALPAFADDHVSGDAEAGERAFNKCKACHMIENADGETILRGGKVGPNLWGLHQRQPGTMDDFNYGEDLVAAGETLPDGWTEEEFVSYVANPREWLSEKLDGASARSKMTFVLRDEEEAQDVWAYLVSVGPEADATN